MEEMADVQTGGRISSDAVSTVSVVHEPAGPAAPRAPSAAPSASPAATGLGVKGGGDVQRRGGHSGGQSRTQNKGKGKC
jgi:hypothetical protein